MARGFYKDITTIESYKNALKDWIVELQYTHWIWYDLIMNPQDNGTTANTKKIILAKLKDLKEEITTNLEKRFIYFISTRTKVRFNIKKKPILLKKTNKVKIEVLIGKNKIKKTVIFKPLNLQGSVIYNPRIEITEKFITIFDETNFFLCYPIHELLSQYNIDLKLNTCIKYVGYTKNPDTRPTNGSHSGFNEVLYNISHEDDDVLIFFNIFKVTSLAHKKESNVTFFMPNSMSDEINVDDEGLIIEKCLILYFNSNTQTKNKEKEKAELKNYLVNMSNNNKINSIQFNYEFEKYNEYWKLYSAEIKPSMKHLFTVKVNNNILELNEGAKIISNAYEKYNKSQEEEQVKTAEISSF